MASCFFLLRQFDDVLVYLKSIKAYFQSDDDFLWNYGLACASTGESGLLGETLPDDQRLLSRISPDYSCARSP